MKLFRWCWMPGHRLITILLAGQVVLVSFAFTSRPHGIVLPVGCEMVRAYELLRSTPTGRNLILDVERATRGSVVYLTVGNTERDRLFDEDGYAVRGLTRVHFRLDGISCRVGRTSVITNLDMSGSDAREIVKSLAYELENVFQIHSMACDCPLEDSPLAPFTQQRISEELGLQFP